MNFIQSNLYLAFWDWFIKPLDLGWFGQIVGCVGGILLLCGVGYYFWTQIVEEKNIALAIIVGVVLLIIVMVLLRK